MIKYNSIIKKASNQVKDFHDLVLGSGEQKKKSKGVIFKKLATVVKFLKLFLINPISSSRESNLGVEMCDQEQ